MKTFVGRFVSGILLYGGGVALVMTVGACALFQESMQQRAGRIEPMLSAAGFNMLPADNDQKISAIQSLPRLKMRYYAKVYIPLTAVPPSAISYAMSKANRNNPVRWPSSDSSFSLMEFERRFPDDAACLEALVQRVHPNGIYCPTCKAVTKHHRETNRPSYCCQNCGRHEHPMRGTIFQDSATSLKLWFYAAYVMSATRCGISAKQLGREIGVTYKTAWRMFHLIRNMLDESGDGLKLSGTVELDESFYGGKEKNKHQSKKFSDHSKGTVGKQPVWGAVERGGRVVTRVVDDTTKATILPHVREHVIPASTVFTDEATMYDPLTGMGYGHKRVHHAAKVYVEGNAHVNTLEGFWSLTKNGIRGVYRSISTKYLQTYLNEYAFRFNRRGRHSPMFEHFLGRVARRIPAAA